MKYKNDFKMHHFVKILMNSFLLKMLFWKRVLYSFAYLFLNARNSHDLYIAFTV